MSEQQTDKIEHLAALFRKREFVKLQLAKVEHDIHKSLYPVEQAASQCEPDKQEVAPWPSTPYPDC